MTPVGAAVVERALDALDRAPALRVAVAGMACLDQALIGKARRRTRRGAPPWVDVVRREDGGGGAAAAATALTDLGAAVRLVAPLGDDHEAERLRRLLVATGIDDRDLVSIAGTRTRASRRVVADDRVVARFDEGGHGLLDRAVLDALAGQASYAAADCDAVLLVGDRRSGVVRGLVDRLVGDLAGHPCVVVVGSELEGLGRIAPRAVVTGTGAIARLALGPPTPTSLPVASERARWLAAHEAEVRRRVGAGLVAVTLGPEGTVVATGGPALYAPPGTPAAGPGDPMVEAWGPAFTVALATGHDALAATHLASVGAGLASWRSSPDDPTRRRLHELVRRRRPPLPLAPERPGDPARSPRPPT
ncbi:MAG: PfkB family carbohydrate kinase [Acidimicrobiales bacterium]